MEKILEAAGTNYSQTEATKEVNNAIVEIKKGETVY